MSTNRIEGAAKETAGSIKQAVGKVVGNEKLQVEGAVEKTIGKAQKAIGKAQDEIADGLRK
ncbi:MAG: CsbD family protein [Pseudomonadota bacterium]